MTTLKDVINLAGRQFTEVGRAFLGSCGGQPELPPKKGISGPVVNLEVLKANPSVGAEQPASRTRRETFLGL